MKQLFRISLVLYSLFAASDLMAQSGSKIMDCTVEKVSGTSNLYVYLTDTILVSGFTVKIGSQLDGSDLYNHEYAKATLPQEASLDYNTLFLPVGILPTGEKYTWVRVNLTTGGYNEIKVTTIN